VRIYQTLLEIDFNEHLRSFQPSKSPELVSGSTRF
jgi:hypothetical protein